MKKVIDMIVLSSESGWGVIDSIKKNLVLFFQMSIRNSFLETNGAKFGDWTLFPIQTNEHLKLTIDILYNIKLTRKGFRVILRSSTILE